MVLSKAADGILKVEEKDSSLFTYRYNGVPIWEITRYPIYKILENQPVEGIKTKFGFKSLSRLMFSFLLNPFFYLSRKNILIFRCTRRNLFGGVWLDLFTKNLETKYEHSEYGIYETELPIHGGYGKNPYSGLIKRLAAKYSSVLCRFSKPSSSEVLAIEQMLQAEGISINYPKLFATHYFRFKFEHFCYKLILRLRSPKIIYMVNYIDKLPLIFEAKKMGIQVHEMQHGYTAPGLILYHYPYAGKDSVSTFPGYFHYINEDYICACDIPVSAEHIIKNDSPYVANKSIVVSTPPDADSILFVSQHLLHRPFFAFLKEFCALNRSTNLNAKVYYKPHPAEYQLLDHTEIENLTANYGLHFLDKTSNIYQAIASVKNVVGVYSTVLLEAKDAGCSIFLINMEGVEHFAALAERYSIPVFDGAQDMVNYFKPKSFS